MTDKLSANKLYRYIPLVILVAAIAALLARDGLVAGGREPFVSYSVEVMDYRLNLVEVNVKYRCSPDYQVSFSPAAGCSIDPLDIAALCEDGEELEVRESAGTWTVLNGRRDFDLSYQVILMSEDRFSPLVRKKLSLLREDRFRFLGSDLFLIPEIKVAGGLLVDYGAGRSGGIFSVHRSVGSRMILENSSQLKHTVCLSGEYQSESAVIGSAEVMLVTSGAWPFRIEEIFSVIKDIVAYEIGMFGSSPHSRYLFVLDRNPVQGDSGFDYYGVHQGPNVLLLFDPRISRSDLYNLNMSVVSHEFFHNWNGEAIRPASERLMWFSEGVTVYYSYKVLLELGIIDRRQYRGKAGRIRESYLKNPYRETVPVADAGNSDMSDKYMVKLMYDGGFLAASALDRHLEKISDGRVSLLDVLRSIYEGNEFGVLVDEELLIDEIRNLTGYDISSFLHLLVHTPGSDALTGAGISAREGV